MTWQIRALPESRLQEAWPLVRLRYPEWTLDTWLTEARSLLADRPSAGILSAENDAGYIYAVCGYQVDSGEADAAEMALRIVVNVGWRAAADPLWPLLTAVDTIARNHDCVGARADGAVIAAAGERSRWEGLGYRWTGKFLRKELSRSKSDSGPGHRSVM